MNGTSIATSCSNFLPSFSFSQTHAYTDVIVRDIQLQHFDFDTTTVFFFLWEILSKNMSSSWAHCFHPFCDSLFTWINYQPPKVHVHVLVYTSTCLHAIVLLYFPKFQWMFVHDIYIPMNVWSFFFFCF